MLGDNLVTFYYLIKSWYHSFIRDINIAQITRRSEGLKVELPCLLRIDNYEGIKIGHGVHIGAFSEIVVIQKNQFSTVMGELKIGRQVTIGTGANIRAAGGAIIIGDYTLLAQNVSLIAANHSIHSNSNYRDSTWDVDKTGIVIGENVWVGANVTILPGVSIGNNSIIASGAVVTKDVPSNEIWGGVPAINIRKIAYEK